MTQYDTFTNKGTREINEDRCGVAMHEDSYCFTVADGLGGHGNGEIAAQAAVDAICTMFVDEGYSDSFFKKAFSAAQDAIVQQQERLQAPSRMKTTLVVLVIHKGKAVWAHVGDSRLYEFKQGKMKGRTIDHSVPQMLAISGEIEEKDIRHHLDRNRLMRVMGIRGETPRYDISPSWRTCISSVHRWILGAVRRYRYGAATERIGFAEGVGDPDGCDDSRKRKRRRDGQLYGHSGVYKRKEHIG